MSLSRHLLQSFCYVFSICPFVMSCSPLMSCSSSHVMQTLSCHVEQSLLCHVERAQRVETSFFTRILLKLFAVIKIFHTFAFPIRWVRITVSTQDSQSCNRSSILLPSTKAGRQLTPCFLLEPRQILNIFSNCSKPCLKMAVFVHGNGFFFIPCS